VARTIHLHRQRAGVAAALSLLLAAGLTACASEGRSDVDEEAAASSPIVSEATENVEQYFENNGAPFELEPVSNPDALDGKSIMYLSAGLSSPSGTTGLAALEEVQAQLGFELIPYDGQFTPSKYQDGMRQAIAQDVDALIVYGVDCAGNEAALKEVRQAGIKIIGLQSVDCNEADPDAEGLFDAQPLYPIGDGEGRIGEVWAANGAAQADYLISKLKGVVKVIQFDVPDFAVTAALGEGFRDRMAECDTCEVVETVDIGVADFGPGLQQKAEQAILKHPDANSIEINYDDLVTLGLSAAITSSGRQDDLLVIAGTGFEATMDLIRKDAGLDAGWVQNHEWDHWAVADTVLRLFSGQEPAVSGVPVILYDEDHNIADSGPFVPETDFRATFEEAWGIG